MAEAAVAGPLDVADLGHEVGPGPAGGLGRRLAPGEGRGLALAGLQLPRELLQHRLVEPRADLAGVDQLAPVVVPDQDRPETRTGPLGGGPPADHQLLLPDALQLQPVLGAEAGGV